MFSLLENISLSVFSSCCEPTNTFNILSDRTVRDHHDQEGRSGLSSQSKQCSVCLIHVWEEWAWERFLVLRMVGEAGGANCVGQHSKQCSSPNSFEEGWKFRSTSRFESSHAHDWARHWCRTFPWFPAAQVNLFSVIVAATRDNWHGWFWSRRTQERL